MSKLLHSVPRNIKKPQTNFDSSSEKHFDLLEIDQVAHSSIVEEIQRPFRVQEFLTHQVKSLCCWQFSSTSICIMHTQTTTICAQMNWDHVASGAAKWSGQPFRTPYHKINFAWTNTCVQLISVKNAFQNMTTLL